MDAWSTSHLSQWTRKPVYDIVDCRSSDLRMCVNWFAVGFMGYFFTILLYSVVELSHLYQITLCLVSQVGAVTKLKHEFSIVFNNCLISVEWIQTWRQESWPFGPGWYANRTRICSWTFHLASCDDLAIKALSFCSSRSN